MNFDKIYLLIGLACISVTFVRFLPIRVFVDRLKSFPGKIYHYIHKILTCVQCLAFWITLVYTLEFTSACIASVMAVYFSYLTSKI